MAPGSRRTTLLVATTLVLAVVLPATAIASHSWASYHWSRTANPFTVRLGDAVPSAWDAYLATASADWSKSSVLDTTIRSSSVDPRKCSATSSQVNVCSAKYGYNGWLGVARIWVSGSHIYQAMVKLNDSYFTTSTYNTPAWRNVVMCQEIGHTFGLDHQDEDFYNPPLGSCMDYAADPVPNQHPNAHDYKQLETIYAHLDGSSGAATTLPKGKKGGSGGDGRGIDQSLWGRRVAVSNGGHTSVHVLGLGSGKRIVTFVVWAL